MMRGSSQLCFVATLCFVAAMTIVGCSCKPTEFAPTSPTFDAINPDCVPTSGGTLVTVEGRSLTHVTGVTINGKAQTLVGASTIGDSLTFETTEMDPGSYAVELDFRYEITNKRGKVCETVTGSLSAGELRFVDSLVPIVHDAHPELADGTNEDGTTFDRLHAEPYEGNCGGGYWIEIYGEDFVQLDTGEIPMVEFHNTQRYAPDVEYDPANPGVLRVKVPGCFFGCGGVWVDVVVRNPPYDCSLDSHNETSTAKLQFFYKQDPCEAYDDSLQFAYADVDTGPLHLDAGDIMSASTALNDLAVACEQTSKTEGSLVVLQGDGNGNVTRADTVDFATEGARPSAIALGDFDGNAFQDAAVTLNSDSLGTSQIAVFYNSGDGYTNSDADYIDVGSDLTDLVVADLDGDGDDDVAAVSRGTGEIVFLEQTAAKTMDAGSWSAAALPGGGSGEADGPFAIATGDFDGGGGPDDLAVATHADAIELFVTASGAGSPVSWSDSVSTGEGLMGVETGEFFGSDGLAAVCAGDGTLELYEVSSGSIDVAPVSHAFTGAEPTTFCVGEFDGDGRDDVAIGHIEGIGVAYMEVIELEGTIVGDSYTIDTTIECSAALGARMNSNDTSTRDDLVMALVYESLVGQVQIAINKGDGFD